MLKKIFYALFLIWAFFYTYFSIQPELLFHQQQPPFFNDVHFFQYSIGKIAGLGMYLSNYLAQFLHSNLTGSLLIVLLMFILSLSVYGILKSLKLNTGLLFLLSPVAIGLVLFHDYHFPLTLLVQTVFVVFTLFLIVTFFNKTPYKYLFVLLFYSLIYYLFGSGTALIFGITSLMATNYKASTKSIVAKTSIFLVVMALLPFLAFKFIFNFSLEQAYFYFLPELPITLAYTKSNLLYLFLIIAPVILLLSFLVSKIKWPERILKLAQNKLLVMASTIALLFVLAGFVYNTFDKHAKNSALVDFYTYQHNWEKAIEVALSDPNYDILTNLNYNMAIDHSGKFLDSFFNYPQLLGIKSLYPDNLNTPIYAIHSSDYYYDINYVSKAQHLAYSALVLEPYSPRIIKQLVKTNLVLGNYLAAETYLKLLSKNHITKAFYNKYIKYVNDPKMILSDPEFSQKRKFQPNNFAIPGRITNRLFDLIETNPVPNQQAYEHLQMCYLLEHNLIDFMNNFNSAMQFYKKIPAIYEQAVLIYIYSTHQRQELLKYISNDSKEQFSTFLNTLKDYNNDLQAAKSSLSGLSNTYMYYMNYQSPRVTNLTVKTKKDE